MDSKDAYLTEELFFNSEVVKRTTVKGDGAKITQGSKLALQEDIYSDCSGSLLSSSKKSYKIILYPEGASLSPYDTVLLTMQEGDQVWVKMNYSRHSFQEASWETIWYHITVEAVDTTLDLMSLPQNFSFLREHRIRDLRKRVLNEGVGNAATVNSRVLYTYEIYLENGCIVESTTGKNYTLTRNISPGMHKGIHLAIYTMRVGEKAVLMCPPGYHVCDKFKSNTVWVCLLVESIEFSTELIYPQTLEYLEEVILKPDLSVKKRIVKQGDGPTLEIANKVWLEITGRLEDGYQFQKPKEEVFNFSTSKVYSECLVLGIQSMKRGEVAWVIGTSDTHLYKEGYENETLWFLITVKEYLEPFEKIVPQMSIEYKLSLSSNLLEISKRLYSSKTKKECKVIYNDIITALKLKKDGFGQLPEDLKPRFIEIRSRALTSMSLLLIKEAEQLEKDDQKIKVVQKVFEYCNEALSYDKKNIKALFRRAQGYYLKKEHASAIQDIENLLEIEPKNKDALALAKRLKEDKKKTEMKGKKIFQGIFNGNKWADEGDREELDKKKREEDERKMQENWVEEIKKKEENNKRRKENYEDVLNKLEKGVIIDTLDAADPVNDMILLE